MRFQRTIAVLMSSTLYLTPAGGTPPSTALMPATGPSGKPLAPVNPQALSRIAGSCKSTCSIFAKGEPDLAWCAAHGADPDHPADPATISSAQMMNLAGCPFPVSASDLEFSNWNTQEACESAALGIRRCRFRNSQLEPQCLAYLAAKDAAGWQMPLLALDAATFLACTAACTAVVPAYAEAQIAACLGVSMATGIAEATAAVLVQDSPVARGISGFMGTVGTLSGTASLATGFNPSLLPNATKDSFKKVLDLLHLDSTNNVEPRLFSCISAASFAVLTGMRAASLIDNSKTRKKACENVDRLASSVSLMESDDFKNFAPRPNRGGALGNPGVLANGSPTSAKQNGGAGGTPAPFGVGSGSFETGGPLIATPITGFPQGSEGSLDGDAFRAGKIDPKILENANQFGKAVTSGQLGSQGIGSIMGAALPEGKGRDQLAEIAALSQANAPALMKLIQDRLNQGATPSQGGLAGKGGAKRGSSTGGLFQGLLGGSAGSGSASEAAFAGKKTGGSASPSSDSDIWHEHYNGSLFQIVSTKLVDSREKVEPLEWCTPLNRALLSMPKSKAETCARAPASQR